MNKLFLFSATLILGFVGCNKKEVDMLQKTIEGADKLELHILDSFATPLEEQENPEAYFMDYKISSTRFFDKSLIKDLKGIVSDTASYAYDNLKSCPFIGGYGLNFISKDENAMLLLSKRNCPKCQIKSSLTDQKMDADLVGTDVYDEIEILLKENFNE